MSCYSVAPSDLNELISINELPEKYRSVFATRFTHFNQIQSSLFDLIINDNKSLVICSPTASGKTVLMELAIIHELIKFDHHEQSKHIHALFLAPLKAIVEEKCSEWENRFSKFGLKCFALTGDTEPEEDKFRHSNYSEVNILLATPEKFDYMIRTNPNSRQLLCVIQLIMIDEVHMLGDNIRGDILEATITRIKSIRDNANNIARIIEDAKIEENNLSGENHLRFIATSATAPNVDDIAAWLDLKNGLGIYVPEECRPVKLRKFVYGLDPITTAMSCEYRFDIQLSYKLEKFIREYSCSKPALVFCSTRRSVEFTAKILSSSQMSYFASHEQRADFFFELSKMSCFEMEINRKPMNRSFKNPDLKSTLQSGVGFYHSGMDTSDRRLLELLYSKSLIPVLVSTSSLAMGVNMPAHLVVIKNTVQYIAGSTVEYDVSQIFQMIGRAGRPQFDTEATAIILTKIEKKRYYESLLNSEKNIESFLFRTLPEQLIVEIVLKTVTDVDSAVDWICSTFLFIRTVKNPTFYGSSITEGDFDGAKPILLKWCQKTMERFRYLGLVKGKDSTLLPTFLARIITRHNISVATTEKLIAFTKSKYSIDKLLQEICSCQELSQDVVLRVNEKKFLKELDSKIKFKLKERFKTNIMKINCLIQATFECLTIETCLYQDSIKAIRSGQRVSKCLIEIFYYLYSESNKEKASKIELLLFHLETLISALKLAQAFRTKMWYDSPYVVRQLPRIGPTYSTALVENGLTNFEKLLQANPRQIEFFIKRNPPFGSILIEEIKSLPKYNLSLRKISCKTKFDEKIEKSIQSEINLEFKCSINQSNYAMKKVLKPENHHISIIIGCQECDQILFFHRVTDQYIISSNNAFSRRVLVLKTDCDDDSALNFKENSSTKGKNAKKNSRTKKNDQESNDNPEIRPLMSEKYINLVEQVRKSPLVKDCLIHFSMKNRISHTIKSFIISESFVGLDTEATFIVNFDENNNNNEENCVNVDIDYDFDDSFDDEDYLQLFEGQNLLNNNHDLSDDSELDYVLTPIEDVCEDGNQVTGSETDPIMETNNSFRELEKDESFLNHDTIHNSEYPDNSQMAQSLKEENTWNENPFAKTIYYWKKFIKNTPSTSSKEKRKKFVKKLIPEMKKNNGSITTTNKKRKISSNDDKSPSNLDFLGLNSGLFVPSPIDSQKQIPEKNLSSPPPLTTTISPVNDDNNKISKYFSDDQFRN